MNRRLTAKDLSYIAMGVALIAVCSWISIPLPVPITLQTFAICLITAVLGVLGMGLFVSVFAELTLTGLVPRFPTLIVSGFILMAALLSLVCGLILDTSGKNARKNFELQLNLLEGQKNAL